MPNTKPTLRLAATLLITGLLIYTCYILLQPLLFPLAMGGILTLLSHPLYNKMLKVLPVPPLASLITILSVLAFLLVPIALFGTILVHEIGYTSSLLHSPNYSLEHVNQSLHNGLLQFGFDSQINVQDYFGRLLELVSSKSSLLLGGFLGLFGILFFMVITSFYLLQSYEQISHLVHTYSPLRPADTKKIIERTRDVIWATVNGNLVLIGLQGLTSFIGFSLFGVSSPILLGILYGISSLIPSIGATLVWLPVAIFQIMTGNTIGGVGIIFWSLGQVILFDNYLGPRLIQQRAHLHPFLILLGILGGVSQFGLFGIILGPTIMALGLVGLELLYHALQSPPE